MATVQVRNQLNSTDRRIPTPDPLDHSDTTTRAKDYLLDVEFANTSLTIELFGNSSNDFDPFVQVYRVPENSPSLQNAVLVAENDDAGGNFNAKIAPGVGFSENGVPGSLTPQSGFDYIVRVTSYNRLPDNTLPEEFTLRAASNVGNLTLKDALTGVPIDANGNPISASQTFQPFQPFGERPVRRFWDFITQSHFYTADPVEIAQRQSNPFAFRDEGNEFTAPGNGNAMVQRFYNTRSGTYFYTNNPNDIIFVRNVLPQFRPEGDAFLSYNFPTAGSLPVHRFTNLSAERRDPQAITHFFTSDESTKQLVQRIPDFRYEGIVFYALPRP